MPKGLDGTWVAPNRSLAEYAHDARYQPQLPPPDGWLSAVDAGIRLGLAAVSIRSMAISGTLDKGYIGKNLFVSVASVKKYEQTRNKPGYPTGKPRKKAEEKQ